MALAVAVERPASIAGTLTMEIRIVTKKTRFFRK